MNAREARGLQIATDSKITREGNVWIVPSQTGSKKYTVNLFIQTCTCPDFEAFGLKCKHIYAVEFALERESGAQLPPPQKVARPTYKQNWAAYRRSQRNEKPRFLHLLYELCKGIEDSFQKRGRPRLPLADIVFAAGFRVYSTLSCERFKADLTEAYNKGYLSTIPSCNAIFDYFNLEGLTSLLLQLIEESSKILREVEEDFATDSSGLATRCYYRWLHQKYSNPHMIDKKAWVKLHLTIGVKTHIVAAVRVTKPDEGDSPVFEELITTTARNFPIREVSADKAYSSVNNLRLVVNKGAMPYIPFRSTTNPESGYDKTGLWKRMYHYYLYNQESFKEHYHKRSNVETAFSMIKAKFNPYVRSKNERAQINEALCKVLCHNMCVVIQSIYELGIDPVFWAADGTDTLNMIG